MNHLKYWWGVYCFIIATMALAVWIISLDEKAKMRRCAERGEIMGLYTEWRPDLHECYVNYKGRKMPIDWLKNKWNY